MLIEIASPLIICKKDLRLDILTFQLGSDQHWKHKHDEEDDGDDDDDNLSLI